MTSRIPPSPSAPLTGHERVTAAERPTVDLRILATTDLHMNLVAWDYERDCPRQGHSLAALAGTIAAARDEARNALLFDNGDFLQGAAMGDRVALDHGDG